MGRNKELKYLFKGKPVGATTYVYGSLLLDPSNSKKFYIGSLIPKKEDELEVNPINIFEVIAYEVIPESIEQYENTDV